MTEGDAIRIASSFIAEQWGQIPDIIGAKAPSKNMHEWTVLFKTVLPGGRPGEVVDGPTVVIVDPRSAKARFFTSM